MEAKYDSLIQEETQQMDEGKNSGSGTMKATVTPKEEGTMKKMFAEAHGKKNASDPQENQNYPQKNSLKSGKK